MGLRGTVVRSDPRRRLVTIALPRVGSGPSFRTDIALPGEKLAPVVQFGHGAPTRRPVGGVVAVRQLETGAEVDVRVTDDSAWQRLAEADVNVDVGCEFPGWVGPDPRGGRVTRVDID
jgi:hypothetical protein